MTTALSNWDIVSDAELARAAATGDRHAFAMIYDRYADRLHDFCVGMVRDRDAAADCVQDVFCAAATQLPRLREPDRLRPWLYAIARNEALRCIRNRRREQASDELPEAASHEAGPDTLAARNELADLIAQAAGGLGDRDRTVLELAYRHGLDGPELADALEVSPGTANKMVSRLRNTIEASLGALLVARRAQHTADKCPELGTILAGWDGRFSVLMRKRITRHIESCPTCDEERRRLVNPAALLGAPVFIPAPAWLRDQTLDKVRLTSAGHSLTTDRDADSLTQSGYAADAPTIASPAAAAESHDEVYLDAAQPRSARRIIPWVALFAAAFLASLGLAFTFLYHHKTAVTPTELSGTAPAPMKPAAPPSAATIPANQAPPSLPGVTVPPVFTPAPIQPPAAPVPPPIPTAQPPIAPPPILPPPAVPPPPIVAPPPVVVLPPPVVVPPPPVVVTPPPVRVTPPPRYPVPSVPVGPSRPPIVPTHSAPPPAPPRGPPPPVIQ